MLGWIDISGAQNEGSGYCKLNQGSDSREYCVGGKESEKVGGVDESGCEERDACAEYFARTYSDREGANSIDAVATDVGNIFQKGDDDSKKNEEGDRKGNERGQGNSLEGMPEKACVNKDSADGEDTDGSEERPSFEPAWRGRVEETKQGRTGEY